MNQIGRIASRAAAMLAPKLIRLTSVLVLGIGGLSGATSAALGVPITYTETATATGSLNGAGFTDATVTLTMTNNTANVNPSSGMFVNNGTTTLSVSGFAPVILLSGSGLSPPTFTDSIEIFSAPGVVGFEASVPPTGPLSPPVAGILFDQSASFAGYDLRTSIGPISGTAEISPSVTFVTTGGGFILSSVEGPTAIFTASTAIPEPSTLAILGVGLLGLGWMRRRERRK